MVKDTEVKYVILESHQGISRPSECLPLVISEIEKNIDEYVSHLTRACRVNGTIYFATEVTLRRSGDIKVGETLTPSFLKTLEDHGMGDFGTGPATLNDTPRVTYVVCESILRRLNSRFTENMTLVGEPLLIVEGQSYKFEDVNFPMTRALHGEDCAVTEIWGQTGDESYPVRLKANFVQPKVFRQGKKCRIVLSNMKVSLFLHLELESDRPLKEADVEPCFKVIRFKVELQEFLWKMTTSKGNISLTPGESLTRSVVLLEEIYETYQNKSPLSTIPLTYHECRLPHLGPTCFMGTLLRTYAIKVTVDLSCASEEKLCKVSLSTFQEISVANLLGFFKEDQLTSAVPCEDLAQIQTYTVIERIPKYLLRLREVAKDQLRHLSKDNSTAYRGHTTTSLVLDTEILAVTTIETYCFGPLLIQPALLHAVQRFETKYLKNFKKTSRANESFIVCEVTNCSTTKGGFKKNELIGGTVLRSTSNKGSRLIANSSFGRCFQTSELQIANAPLDLDIWNLYTNFALVARFKCHSRFACFEGQNVVVPGMNLSEFLDLEFRLPFAFEFGKKVGFVWNDYSFHVSRVIVTTKTKLQGNSCLHREQVELARKLFDQNFAECVKWTQFQDAIYGCPVNWKLPPRLFDCEVPDFGPSFCSNEVTRQYCLEVEVHVEIEKSLQPVRMIVAQDVQIAGIDCNGGGSDVPSSLKAIAKWAPLRPAEEELSFKSRIRQLFQSFPLKSQDN